MAMEFGGFSIREYASRMRSVNVVKCWPFDETNEDEVKSLLPPISVKKFTWWFDKLELARSESNTSVRNSKKKKKKVREKGESSSEAANVKGLRGKPKAPKKRSIVEIFAVAPQVHRVVSSEEEEEEEEISDSKEMKWGLKGKRNEKIKNKKEILLNKLKKPNKKIKKLKKKKKSNEDMNLPVANKEKCFKLPTQSQGLVKELDIDLSDAIRMHKEKPKVECFGLKKKSIGHKSSKVTRENGRSEFPMRGILKNRKEVFPLLQSRNCILQESVQRTPCGTQQVNKRVTFSDEDDIQKIRGSVSVGVASSLIEDHDGERGNSSTVTIGTSKTQDISSGTGSAQNAQAASKKHLTITYHEFDTSNFVKKHGQEGQSGTHVTSYRSASQGINVHLLERGNREPSHNPLSASPGFFSTYPEGHSQCPNISVIRSSSSSYNNHGRLIENLGDPSPGFPPIHFKDYPKKYNEPSTPYLYNKLEKISNTMPQFRPQSFPHLSPKELLGTFCFLPEVDQGSQICEKKGMDGDIFGLPLNSQGELISLKSNSKGEFQKTIVPSITAASSINLALNGNVIPNCLGNHSECRSWECATSHGDQLNHFPVNGYVKENHIAVIPSRLGISGSQRDETTNTDLNLIGRNDRFLNRVGWDLDPETESYPGSQEHYQKSRKLDCVLPHLVESKMRLMGKEFVVCGDELWKDKQIIADHQFGRTAIDNVTVFSQKEPSLGKFRESLACPLETEIKHRSESMFLTKTPDSRFPFSHLALQNTDMHQNDLVTSKNPVPGLYARLSPRNLSAIHDTVTHGYDSEIVSSVFPMPRPPFLDHRNHVNTSFIQLQNRQEMHGAPRSPIQFPFICPDLGHHPQSSWSLSSSKNVSPLLFNVADRETFLNYGRSHSNFDSSFHPRTMPGTDYWTDPRVSLTREAFCLHNNLGCGPAFQNPIAPAPLIQRVTSCYSGITPNSFLPKSHGSQMNFKESARSRMSRRGPSHGKKDRKRVSAASHNSSKPMKMPNLGILEASKFTMTKPITCINCEGDAENTGQPPDFAKDKAKVMGHGEPENDEDENTVLTRKDSSNGTAKSGPVKLTAGGKHILKACQKLDLKSLKSSHSTFTFAKPTPGFSLLESEKSTQIYRF